MIAIIGGAGGELFGGFLVFKYKMSVHGILKLCILFSFLAFLCFLVDLIECPNARKYEIILYFLQQISYRCLCHYYLDETDDDTAKFFTHIRTFTAQMADW